MFTEPSTCTSYINRLHQIKPESRWNFICEYTHSPLLCFQELRVPLWGILIEVQGSSAEKTTHTECIVSLKVFVSASWDHTQVFREQPVGPSEQNTESLRRETSFRHLDQQLWWGILTVSCLKQAVLTEAKIGGYLKVCSTQTNVLKKAKISELKHPNLSFLKKSIFNKANRKGFCYCIQLKI